MNTYNFGLREKQDDVLALGLHSCKALIGSCWPVTSHFTGNLPSSSSRRPPYPLGLHPPPSFIYITCLAPRAFDFVTQGRQERRKEEREGGKMDSASGHVLCRSISKRFHNRNMLYWVRRLKFALEEQEPISVIKQDKCLMWRPVLTWMLTKYFFLNGGDAVSP